MPSREEIVDRFTYHAPNWKQKEMLEQVHAKVLDLALYVGKMLEPGAEQEQALTALEDVRMKINKAIIFDVAARGLYSLPKD